MILIHAESAQLIEKDGQSFRKVIGPARFLHNDTYLLCDTALWNVNTNGTANNNNASNTGNWCRPVPPETL